MVTQLYFKGVTLTSSETVLHSVTLFMAGLGYYEGVLKIENVRKMLIIIRI